MVECGCGFNGRWSLVRVVSVFWPGDGSFDVGVALGGVCIQGVFLVGRVWSAWRQCIKGMVLGGVWV